MERKFLITGLFLIVTLLSCKRMENNPFWGNGEEFFEIQKVFDGGRFPNVIIAMDGSVIATWGSKNYMVRRSEDGGNTWGPIITVVDSGIHSGGATVDENTGDIWVFTEEKHPVAPLRVFRSKDHGITWQKEEVVVHPDVNGNVPAMHMCEHGITLKYGPKAGRLLRPARFFGSSQGYNTAVYSDDGGKNWYPSKPFPAFGTGEGTLAELSDGRIYYNSRRHWAPEGVNALNRWIAWSYDGGESWEDLSISDELPDGNQNSNYGLMGGLVRLPLKNHDILLFSNIESPEGRRNGVVWASFDGGKTWPVKKVVDPGPFSYSSLNAGRKGTPSEGIICLMYEGGGGKMARFNLAWLTEGKDWRDFLDK